MWLYTVNFEQRITKTMNHDKILRFFEFDHLPAHLQAVSRPFCELARTVAETLPYNAESAVTLRKLLEAKDAAVRSLV